MTTRALLRIGFKDFTVNINDAASCAPCWKRRLEIDDFVPQPYGEGFTTKYEEVVNNYD